MRKKIRKIQGFIYYFIVSFSILLLLFILQKKLDNIEEIHRLYSKNVIEVRTSNMETLGMLKYFEQSNKKEMKVVMEELHPFFELKGIYYKGKVLNIPTIQGRFLTSDECRGDENKIVIGYQYVKEIYEKNSRKYYCLEGEEYEVVGIIGRKTGSRFNTMIFLPFKTVVARYGTSGVYLIDGMAEQIPSMILKDNSNKQDEINVNKIYDGYLRDFFREIKEDNGMIGIYVFLLFLIIVCSFLGMKYFLRIRPSNIKAYKILGISAYFIVKRYMKEYGVIIFASFVTSIICGKLFRKILDVYLINYHIVLIGFLIFYVLINAIFYLKIIISVRGV